MSLTPRISKVPPSKFGDFKKLPAEKYDFDFHVPSPARWQPRFASMEMAFARPKAEDDFWEAPFGPVSFWV